MEVYSMPRLEKDVQSSQWHSRTRRSRSRNSRSRSRGWRSRSKGRRSRSKGRRPGSREKRSRPGGRRSRSGGRRSRSGGRRSRSGGRRSKSRERVRRRSKTRGRRLFRSPDHSQKQRSLYFAKAGAKRNQTVKRTQTTKRIQKPEQGKVKTSCKQSTQPGSSDVKVEVDSEMNRMHHQDHLSSVISQLRADNVEAQKKVASLTAENLKLRSLATACVCRVVSCPSVHCGKKVPLARLVKHTVSECKTSKAEMIDASKGDGLGEVSASVIFFHQRQAPCSHSLRTIRWGKNIFFLSVNFKQGQGVNVYVQLLGDKQECLGFTVDIIVRSQGHGAKLHQSPPYPIETKDEDKPYYGLFIHEKVFPEMMFKEGEQFGFKVELVFKENV